MAVGITVAVLTLDITAVCLNNNQKKEEIEDIPLNLINGGNNAGRKK